MQLVIDVDKQLNALQEWFHQGDRLKKTKEYVKAFLHKDEALAIFFWEEIEKSITVSDKAVFELLTSMIPIEVWIELAWRLQGELE